MKRYGRILFVLVVSDNKGITNLLILSSEEQATNAALLMIREKAAYWGLSPSIADEPHVVERWQQLTGGKEKIQIFQSPTNEEE